MRMYNNLFCSLLFAHCYMCAAHGVTSTPVSQYGVIQNVSNYSSNPFWNPNGPYNQRIPSPVYVDGPEMNAGDCIRTVSALVANICDTANKCAGMQLSDIRPTLMVQLSQLPGHAYATSCAGYIDSEFEKYMANNSRSAAPSGTVAFPTTTSTAFPQPTTNNSHAAQLPQWQREYNERAAELAQLQDETSERAAELAHTDFPKTFADVEFSDRMDVLQAGYEPYKDKSAYHPIKLQAYEDYLKEIRTTKPRNITYTCGKGTGTPPADNTAYVTKPFTPESGDGCTPPSDDMVLTAWQIKETGAQLTPGIPKTWTYEGDATLVAQYGNKDATITFTCGNGAGEKSTQTVKYKETLTFPASTGCTPPDGQVFSGWKFGDQTYQPNAKINNWTHGDKTITAVYKETTAVHQAQRAEPTLENLDLNSLESF